MQKQNGFFQNFFKADSAQALEDYRSLKENIDNVEFSLSKPKAVCQYVEIRSRSRK